MKKTSEGDFIQIYAKQCEHYFRKTLPRYEHEFTCIACGYNPNKGKMEGRKFSGKN